MTDEQFDSLINQLNDPNQREAAIEQLAPLKDPRAVVPLGNIIRQHRSDHAFAYRARQKAVEALAQIDDPRVLSPLLIALEDENSAVKISAARAIGQLGNPIAAEDLLRMVEDSSAEVRVAAVQAFGQLAADAEVDLKTLIPLLADFDDDVRDAAEAVLVQLGVKVQPMLIDALTDPNSTIRGAVATILGTIKNQEAIMPLHEVFVNDESDWVRSRAKKALDQLPDIEVLVPRLKKPDVQVPQTRSTLDVVREQAPKSWPTLDDDDDNETIERQHTPAVLSAKDIFSMLDALDVRLIEGEISEETYQRMTKKWMARLDSLTDDDDDDD